MLQVRLSAVATSLAFAGCMVVGTDFTPPDTIVPDSWNQSLSADLHSGSSSLESWWTRFNDPGLNRAVAAARESNRDLAIAFERINEARAARGIARSQLFPSIDFDGGVSRGRTSDNIGSPAGGATSDFWATGLDAGWELDFFGGVSRAIESADATVAGTEELYRDTMVSLLAETALAYIQVHTFDERIRLAQENIENQQATLTLTEDRLEAGLSPELDVSQATSNLANTRAAVPALRNERDIALNRLATLMGRYPAAAESFVSGSGGIPVPPNSAGVGIPADLVRARPDIRAAERSLAAQNALVGVAEADLFPRFTLSGTFDLQSLTAPDVFESGSRNYSFGPSFRWNIFSAGRIRNQIQIEESRTRQAFLNYEATVLGAVEEVENALSSVRNERDRLGALDTAVESSARTVELTRDNYGEGLIDFQPVLDAERTIFSAQDERAISQGRIAVSYVALYKSLGGGTRMESSKAADASGS